MLLSDSDGMGGVNHLADVIGIMELCDQIEPMVPPYGADGRELFSSHLAAKTSRSCSASSTLMD